VAAVVLAGVVVAVVVLRGGGGGVPTGGADDAEPVAVSSDAPGFRDLAGLDAASDLVVAGRVTATAAGRWFGEGDDGARIRSRLVTLAVDEVLRPPGSTAPSSLLVEEEGWLEDGSPLVVDGAAPSRVGDEGIWFLRRTGDGSTDAWIVVNAQGRYLVAGDRLRGAEGDDPLVAQVEALDRAGLVDALRGLG
jgi:hypothetical protein